MINLPGFVKSKEKRFSHTVLRKLKDLFKIEQPRDYPAYVTTPELSLLKINWSCLNISKMVYHPCAENDGCGFCWQARIASHLQALFSRLRERSQKDSQGWLWRRLSSDSSIILFKVAGIKVLPLNFQNLFNNLNVTDQVHLIFWKPCYTIFTGTDNILNDFLWSRI
jgi:hypothetical protein